MRIHVMSSRMTRTLASLSLDPSPQPQHPRGMVVGAGSYVYTVPWLAILLGLELLLMTVVGLRSLGQPTRRLVRPPTEPQS